MRIAVAQLRPTADPEENSGQVTRAVGEAAERGARLLLAPEGSIADFLTDPQATRSAAQPVDGPFGQALCRASAAHDITVAAGSFVPDEGTGRVFNSLLIARRGEIVAEYRKLHLYDAFSFAESDTVTAGAGLPPVVEIDGVPVGFATCYDLRFPELFRTLVDRGAAVLAVASAWVRGPLKEEHWLTLLRARAIENTAYVVAADQVGRAGIGRSAAFDPSGLQLLDLGAAENVVGTVDVEPAAVDRVRQVNPALLNRRFTVRLSGEQGSAQR